MPQIENVTQIRLRAPAGGHPNGVEHEREAVRNEGIQARYQKATRKEKKAVLDEFTRLTGYHRKSAVRLLGAKPARQVTVHANGRSVKWCCLPKRVNNRRVLWHFRKGSLLSRGKRMATCALELERDDKTSFGLYSYHTL